MSKTMYPNHSMPAKQPPMTARLSIDLSHICRLLPSDLKYGTTKNFSSSQMHSREHDRIKLRNSTGGMPNHALGIGSQAKQMRALESYSGLQEKKNMR